MLNFHTIRSQLSLALMVLSSLPVLAIEKSSVLAGGKYPGLGLQWCTASELQKGDKWPARVPIKTTHYDSGDIHYNAKVGLFKDLDNGMALSWSFTDPAGEWLNPHIYNDVDDLTNDLVVNPQVDLKILCDSANVTHRFIQAEKINTLPAYYSQLQPVKSIFKAPTRLCAASYNRHRNIGLVNLIPLPDNNEETCLLIYSAPRTYLKGNFLYTYPNFQYLMAIPDKVPIETMPHCQSKTGYPWKVAPEPLLWSKLLTQKKTLVAYCKHYTTPDSYNIGVRVGVEYPETLDASLIQFRFKIGSGCHFILPGQDSPAFSPFSTLASTRYQRLYLPTAYGWEAANGYREDSRAGCVYSKEKIKGYNFCRVNDPNGYEGDPYSPYKYGYVINDSHQCITVSSRVDRVDGKSYLRYFQSTHEVGEYEIYTGLIAKPKPLWTLFFNIFGFGL